MAELHVQRKRSSFSWFWLLIMLIAIATGIYLYLHYSNPQRNNVQSKSTSSIGQGNRTAVKTIQV